MPERKSYNPVSSFPHVHVGMMSHLASLPTKLVHMVDGELWRWLLAAGTGQAASRSWGCFSSVPGDFQALGW